MSLLDPDKLFHNNGDGTFTEISAAAGVNNPAKSGGFAYGDYDNDGDIDMLVIPIIALQSTDTTSILLYRNELNNTNQYLYLIIIIMVIMINSINNFWRQSK